MFKKKEILTIPNLLSLIRLLCCPIIVLLYHFYKESWITALVIIFAGLTDVVDGFVARKFNMVSDFGKFFDACADKVTDAILFILLVKRNSLFIAATAILVLREGMLLIYGFYALKVTEQVKGSRWYGKICACLIYAVVLSMMFFTNMPKVLENTFIIIMCVAMIISMILYIINYHKTLNSDERKNEIEFNLKKYIIYVICVAIVVVAIFYVKDLSLNDIKHYTPSNTTLAVLVILGLFALKSLTFVIHIDILYAACAMLFDLPLALTVDLLGTVITFIIPYLVGKHQGYKLYVKLLSKYPKIEAIAKKRENNDFAFTLSVRFIGGIPYDITSYLMGAMGVKFIPYIIAGTIAMIPDIVLSQMVGANLFDPTNPKFILGISIKVGKIIISLLILLLITKVKSKKKVAVTEGSTETLATVEENTELTDNSTTDASDATE